MELTLIDRLCLWIHNELMEYLGIKVTKVIVWLPVEKANE